MVVVAVLDGGAGGFLGADRILDVEAVMGPLASPVRATGHGQAVIGSGVALGRAPGGVEVVLGPGPMQRRREALAVDKDHVVALAVPVEEVEPHRAKVVD